jgi:hypothetical protein
MSTTSSIVAGPTVAESTVAGPTAAGTPDRAVAAKRSRLVAPGLAAAAAASCATALVAAAGHAAGISLEVGGEAIPVQGFALLTALFSVVGLALAAVLRRAARHPRRAFVRTCLALTALSLLPDALADAAASTKALLMLTHIVAAAIVIPVIARRLSRG